MLVFKPSATPMREGGRYERLQNMEERAEVENEAAHHNSSCVDDQPMESDTLVETESVPEATLESPPPYDCNNTRGNTDGGLLNESPPLYSDVVKLPTYEELESNHRESQIQRFLGFGDGESNDIEESSKLGSDFGFILCFVLSFLMNWLGFIVGYCFTNTLASHYGALSGFGLSMVKWAFIMRHADCCRDYLVRQPWVMWLFAIFGWLIFIRGALAYLQLKRLARMNARIQVWGWGI